MADNIPGWFVETYTDNIRHALQNTGGKFRRAVTEGAYKGTQASVVDLLEGLSMKAVSQRLEPIVNDDPNVSRVWVHPQDFYVAPIVDHFDKLRLMTDPQSAITQATITAAARKIDQIIANAFFAPVRVGVNGGQSVAFDDATYLVDATVGGSSGDQPLNAQKIFAGLRILQEAEINTENEEVFIAISPEQNMALLSDSRVTNSDFIKFGGVIQNGVVTHFAGVNVIVSTHIKPVSGMTLTPMWVRSGMHLGVWEDVKVSVDQRKDIVGLPWQIHTNLSMGATATEAGKVVKIENASVA